MRQQRPAPPVTISGGPAGAAPRVLAGAEPEDEDEPRPVRRRRRGPLLLTGLALLGVLGVAELRERAAAEEAARAEAQLRLEAIDLALTTEPSASTSYDAATDSITFVALLRVRNDGQRAVRIDAVDLPGVQLLAPATLAVGRERSLTLRGQRSCGEDLAGLLDLDRLPLEVRTEAGRGQADLALDGTLLDGDAIRRACGLTRPGLS